MELKWLAENYLFKPVCHRSYSLFQLDAGHVDWNLLQVQRAIIWVKLVELRSILDRPVIFFCQIRLLRCHFSEEGLRFCLSQFLVLTLDLEACHRVVLLHEPGLILVLLPKSFSMLFLVLAHVSLVLTLELVKITAALHT